MSTELLINIDKPVSKNAGVSSTSSKNDNLSEKKEGISLFDSLLNEAKTENVDSKNTEQKTTSETKTEQKTTSETKTEQKATSEIQKEIPNPSKIDGKITSEVSENQKNLSIEKMVEKLVDIVVNRAKEIFDKNSEKNVNQHELKSTVENIIGTKLNDISDTDKSKNIVDEKIVNPKELKSIVESIIENKINNISDNDKLKSIIGKKLEIIEESIDLIKKEVKNTVLNSDDSKSKEKNPNINQSSSLDSPAKDLKEIIKSEVSSIKENVKEIKKDVSQIIQKENIQDLKPSDKTNENIKTQIDNNLSVIEESSNEIKIITSAIDTDNKKEYKSPESLQITEDKVDHKVKIIKEVISNIKENINEIIIVKTTGESMIKKEEVSLFSTGKNKEISQEDAIKPLLATMFLNAQKTAKNKNSLDQIKDAKSNIIEKKTIESVKVSAEKLDLLVEETEVTHEEEKGKKPISLEKKDELKNNNLINNRTLNRVLLDQRIEAKHIIKERNEVTIQKEITTNIDQEKRNIESIEMNVPKDVVASLQNKIIGAQQKVGSFMSEVARNMYLNYKPPVTAFRVNLNPANLGTISIMMKANKVDNSLTVSMNLSNSNTMEAFTENKALLQNAIQRQFNETSNVTVDFNMQDQSSDNVFDQNQNNKDNQKNQNENSEIDDNILEEQEIVENNDYM